MENHTISISIAELGSAPYEVRMLATERLPFLLPVTPVIMDGSARLLYACEGAAPLAQIGDQRGLDLNDLFILLRGYLLCLADARDRLLNTAHIGSDPQRSVFVLSGEKLCAPDVRVLYGPDELSDENDKICRVADALAAHRGIMGAEPALGAFSRRARERTPTLSACLKLAESVQREWNYVI
ncbi:MAG: DUF6382 domain-containing protein [Clostridiales bacterium]|nr:DUF6382 domain-containing protein [Clostridiales bacterium]